MVSSSFCRRLSFGTSNLDPDEAVLYPERPHATSPDQCAAFGDACNEARSQSAGGKAGDKATAKFIRDGENQSIVLQF